MNRISFWVLFFAFFLHTGTLFADEKAERIARLKSDISKLNNELGAMRNDVPTDIKTQNFLRCYITCIKMAPVTCRVQMSVFRKKSIPGGMYFIDCRDTGKKCNYPGYGIRNDDKRRHYGCIHFDKNGYWFVTYVCAKHRYKWNFDLVQKYKALEKRYYRFDHVIARYQLLYNQREAKRKELNILEPPQLDFDDEEEEDAEDEPDFVTLHLGVENFVIIDLKNNKFIVSRGAKNVGSDPKLAQKAPAVYFKRGACYITQGENKREVWNLNTAFNIDFDADKIDTIKVLKPSKKNVKVYKLDKKNQAAVQKDSGNKVVYTSSQIGIYNKGSNVEEYKIKIIFK